MTHDPGRERHMIYRCEKCGVGMPNALHWNRLVDEYWCERCFDEKEKLNDE